MFESGICGQLGFFSSPLIYTVCSETHQGLFRLGVCFGDRPSISALCVGTAPSAAPGGPVGHKTSRGLLALCVASFHLVSVRSVPRKPGSPGTLAARVRGCPLRGLHLQNEGLLKPGQREGWGADPGVHAALERSGFPEGLG